MGSAVFLGEVPKFEIRGDMVFIEIEGQPTFCASLYTLRMSVATVERLLRKVDDRPSNIIPACAMCEKRTH